MHGPAFTWATKALTLPLRITCAMSQPELQRVRACRRQDPPLYPFGHGLSYTTFIHSGLTVSTHATFSAAASTAAAAAASPASSDAATAALEFGIGDEMHVRATVSNTGARAARWPVLLFVGDDFCIVPPSPRMLKGFEKVALGPGESATVHFQVRPHAVRAVLTQLAPPWSAAAMRLSRSAVPT